MQQTQGRYVLAFLLALATLVAWGQHAPEAVALGLQLACLLAAGVHALGPTWRPLWWVLTVTTALGLLLTLLLPFVD